MDDAGRGLGKLLAAVANLTVPQMIVLGGEGVGLVDVARDAVRAGILEWNKGFERAGFSNAIASRRFPLSRSAVI